VRNRAGGGRTLEMSSFECPTPRGVFPALALQSCSPMYHQCVDSLPTTRQCADGRFFSAQTGACLPASLIAACDETSDELTDVECEGVLEGATLPRTAGQMCSPLYIQCRDGRASTRQCAGEEIFASRACQSAERVSACRVPAAPSMQCPSESGVFALPDKPCSPMYLECRRGMPMQQSCVEGRLFDEERVACVPRRLIAKC